MLLPHSYHLLVSSKGFLLAARQVKRYFPTETTRVKRKDSYNKRVEITTETELEKHWYNTRPQNTV